MVVPEVRGHPFRVRRPGLPVRQRLARVPRSPGPSAAPPLPAGLVESDRIDPPIFTPATKAEAGHDENVPFEAMAEAIGEELAAALADRASPLYRAAADHAETRG